MSICDILVVAQLEDQIFLMNEYNAAVDIKNIKYKTLRPCCFLVEHRNEQKI